MVPIVLLVLTYMTKILIGVPSMNALPDVLFSKVSIMRLLGFNAHILALQRNLWTKTISCSKIDLRVR